MSVTSGGGLFHLPSLHHTDEPFAAFVIRLGIPADSADFLLPHSPMAHTLCNTILALSDCAWLDLGYDIDEAPSAPGASALSEEQIWAIVQPIVSSKARSTKEIEQSDTANDVARYYQLALASFPTSSSSSDNVAVIPTLDPLFLSMLQKSQPSGAAKTLRELIATKVEVCHASSIGIDTKVCLDPDVCNIAFSNLIRSFHWRFKLRSDSISRQVKL